ncbi:MAG: regulatory iron-sulfur-containing complex subunit RicT [Raoultibacter sp.]
MVKTERGIEYGHATDDIMEVDEADVKKLKSALKPVVRLASDEDSAKAAQLDEKARAALPLFRELVAESGSDMHPVMVEYLFDGDKAIFYFSAEERVDFRELVRKLAAQFHVRVDMRQIGVRDEARIVGGLGHCGQELCCKRLGGEFCPVSIRMAKEQDLSLNPQKISGVCGRLMCCLRYEFDAYKEFKGRAPKVGAKIETPEGVAKVINLNVPREIVSLKMEDAKIVKVPLEEMDPPEPGVNRPSAVGEEAFERCTADTGLIGDSAAMIFSTPNFTGTDKLAEGAAHASRPRGSRKAEGEDQSKGKSGQPVHDGRKPRRRRGGKSGDAPSSRGEIEGAVKGEKTSEGAVKSPRNAKGNQQKSGEPRKQRTPRSRSGSGSGQTRSTQNGEAAVGGGAPKSGVRPGQNSSGLRNGATRRRPRNEANGEGAKREGAPTRTDSPTVSSPSDAHRKARRRSRKTGGTESEA